MTAIEETMEVFDKKIKDTVEYLVDLCEEKDTLIQQNGALKSENDWLQQQNMTLKSENDALLQQNGVLTSIKVKTKKAKFFGDTATLNGLDSKKSVCFISLCLQCNRYSITLKSQLHRRPMFNWN
jgi:FtsZ-binding cell division protein ZapB